MGAIPTPPFDADFDSSARRGLSAITDLLVSRPDGLAQTGDRSERADLPRGWVARRLPDLASELGIRQVGEDRWQRLAVEESA